MRAWIVSFLFMPFVIGVGCSSADQNTSPHDAGNDGSIDAATDTTTMDMPDTATDDDASDAEARSTPCDPKNDMCTGGKKCCPAPQTGDGELDYICVALRPPAETCPTK